MLYTVPEKFPYKRFYRQKQQCGFVADIEQMRCKKRELMPSLSLLTLFIHQRNRLVGGHVRLNETNYIW